MKKIQKKFHKEYLQGLKEAYAEVDEARRVWCEMYSDLIDAAEAAEARGEHAFVVEALRHDARACSTKMLDCYDKLGQISRAYARAKGGDLS